MVVGLLAEAPRSNNPKSLRCFPRIRGDDTGEHRAGVLALLTIELTRGHSWREPAEILDRRECATKSVEAAAAEAWAWLVETQKHAPARGATHYRVIGPNELAIGGPTESERP
jgi:hypothetical protein